MQNLQIVTFKTKLRNNPLFWLYTYNPLAPHLLFSFMTLLLLEKDADAIYEELQDADTEDLEEEYREDRMDQMISRYGY